MRIAEAIAMKALLALTVVGVTIAVLYGSVLTALAIFWSAVVLYGVHFIIWLRRSFPSRISLPAATLLVGQLRGARPNVRRKVANSLRGIGPDSTPLLPRLIDGLQDQDSDVRRSLLLSIAKLGPNAAPAIDALTGILASDNRSALWAAIGLGKIGPAARRAASSVERRLRDEDDLGSRVLIAETLWNIGGDIDAITPVFVSALMSHRKPIRLMAVRILVRMGAAAQPSIDALYALLISADPSARRSAQRAIQQFEKSTKERERGSYTDQ